MTSKDTLVSLPFCGPQDATPVLHTEPLLEEAAQTD